MAVAGEHVQSFVAARRDGFRAPAFHGFPQNLPPFAPDGLPTLPIKPHSLGKLAAVGRYCNACTRALKNSWRTTYVDLYAGPGALELAGGKLVCGSPLIALQCADPFHSIICVEKDRRRCSALLQRARRVAGRGEKVSIINGAAEEVLDHVAQLVPPRSVAVTLIDPFRIESSLAAIKVLARSLRRLDLVLLFAEGMDLRRNLTDAVNNVNGHGDRFDAVFGGGDWRHLVDHTAPAARNAGRLRDLYLKKLRQVGFSNIGTPVSVRNARHAQVYLLMYASRHPLGVRLWDESTEPSQQELFD